MDWVLASVAIAIAMIVLGALAHHGFMRWLDDRAATRIQENVLAETSRRLDEHDIMVKKLAEDWLARFNQLVADWRKVKEHAESQYAGAMSQLPSTRGFGR
jgi:hypothetical protein